MFRVTALFAAVLSLAACDSVVRGAANTTGYAAKQTVRAGYAVGKGATRSVYRGGRYVIVGPDGREVAPDAEAAR